MAGWTRHQGLAVGLPFENIDTDQLIPARFMSAPRSEGYGKFLLHDLRHDGDGATIPDFPLNHPAATGASILVARRNFGGGLLAGGGGLCVGRWRLSRGDRPELRRYLRRQCGQ